MTAPTLPNMSTFTPQQHAMCVLCSIHMQIIVGNQAKVRVYVCMHACASSVVWEWLESHIPV